MTGRVLIAAVLLTISTSAVEVAAQDAMPAEDLVRRGDLYLHPRTLEPYSGPVLSMWDGQIVRERGTLVDGKWDGRHEWFHFNGQLSTREHWSNGLLNGPSESWFRSGQPSVVEHYVDGKLHGQYVAHWHYRGIAEEGQWNNDEQCGEWQSFGRTYAYPECPAEGS